MTIFSQDYMFSKEFSFYVINMEIKQRQIYQGFLTCEKLISMQRDYTNFQNKVLFEDLQWEKIYTLDQPERGKKYLPLPILFVPIIIWTLYELILT